MKRELFNNGPGCDILSDNALIWRDLTFKVKQKEILKGVSAVAPVGKVTCLLGASGSGKSALLRLSAGLETPSGGKIYLRGEPADRGGESFIRPEKRRIAFMFQDYALFPHMTALRNVMFADKKSAEPEKIARARKILGDVGLGAHTEKYPHQLSGGEAQRLALARAVMQNTDIVFLDEPFSNLDENLREKLRDETVGYLKALKKTQIIVTHNPDEAFLLSDHIIFMREGRVVQSGAAEEIYRFPVDKDAVRFTGGVNIFPGEIADGKITTALGIFPAPSGLTAPGAAYIRLHAFDAAPPDTFGAFEAHIIEKKFCGPTVRYTLVKNDKTFTAEFPVYHDLAPSGPSFYLTVRTDGLFVFPD